MHRTLVLLAAVVIASLARGLAAADEVASARRAADWVHMLKDPSSRVRSEAVQALAKSASLTPEDISAITQLLGHEQQDVREAACRALEEIGPRAKPAIPALLSVLNDKTKRPRERVFAAWALGGMGPEAAQALPDLIDAMYAGRSGVHAAAIDAIGEMGPSAAPAVPALWHVALTDYGGGFGWSNHVKACRALAKIGEPGVHLLVEALRDEDVDKRITAADVLARIAATDPRAVQPAVPGLRETLDDPDPFVRLLTARALWRATHKAEEVIPVLVSLLRNRDVEKHSETLTRRTPPSLHCGLLRPNAADTLGLMGASAKEAVPVLIERLKDESESYYVREAALEALGKIGPDAKAALPHMVQWCWSPERHVRKMAAEAMRRVDPEVKVPVEQLVAVIRARPLEMHGELEALGEIDRESRREAVPLLIDLLGNPDYRVRMKAAEALMQIGPDATAASEALKRLESDEEASVRRAATKALKVITRERR